jgi:formamidopyrimidine-DNA glycosylase
MTDVTNDYFYEYIQKVTDDYLKRIGSERQPALPPNYSGNCKHNVGIYTIGGLNCTSCGYFISYNNLTISD